MARALKEVGFPDPRNRSRGFASLLRIIVCQQVSNEAGAAIWGKLEKRLKDVSADKVLRVREGTLRCCGLSRPKARYAKILAQAINTGELDLNGLNDLSNDEVRAALTAITGIGPWTAEIYLMFALGRPDILPAGDLALAVATKDMFDLDERPRPVQLESIAKRWRPYRTAAAIMLWHYYRRTPLID